MDVTKNVAHYIREKGIALAFICEKTGLSKNVVYPSLAQNGTRKLRADEFFMICEAIEANPIELAGRSKTDQAS